jgi:DNA-binding MarR family transcriptional regulator
MGSGKPRTGNQRLFAFWKYSSFPYILGGEVARFCDNGLVYIESYRSTFRPVRVVLYAEGKKLWDEMSALRQEHDDAEKKLREDFLAKAEKLFGEVLDGR